MGQPVTKEKLANCLIALDFLEEQGFTEEANTLRALSACAFPQEDPGEYVLQRETTLPLTPVECLELTTRVAYNLHKRYGELYVANGDSLNLITEILTPDAAAVRACEAAG